MTNTFIRDLAVDPRARQARQAAGFEETETARMISAFRPWVKTQPTSQTGPTGLTGQITMGGAEFKTVAAGMYDFSWTGDTEVLEPCFLGCFMVVNGGNAQQAFNSTSAQRSSIALGWGGPLAANITVKVQMSVSGGSAVVYGGNFVIRRLA